MDENDEKKPIPIWKDDDKIGGLKPGFSSIDEWFGNDPENKALYQMGLPKDMVEKIIDSAKKLGIDPVEFGWAFTRSPVWQEILRLEFENLRRLGFVEFNLEGSYSTKLNHYERMMRNLKRRKKK